MSSNFYNNTADSELKKLLQTKIEKPNTRQTTLFESMKNCVPIRNSLSPKPDSKRNLSFLNNPYESNFDADNELLDRKINKISKNNNNGSALKKPTNSKTCEITISVNKRRNDAQEVEILELKQKKMIKIEEDKEDSKQNNLHSEKNNQEGKSSKKITEVAFQANLLSKMKSYEFSHQNLLPKDIERPSIYKIYNMPREKTQIFWTLPNDYVNIMIEDFKRKKCEENGDQNEDNILKIKSESFRTQTELQWKFSVCYQKDKARLCFFLKAEKNEEEKLNPEWKRNVIFSFSVFQTNSNYEKTVESTKVFNEDNKDCGIFASISNFDMLSEGRFIVETNIKMNNGFGYDSKEKTKYVGLINAGNTCYMNSFLQTLYHLSSFTRCVLKMPIAENENTSMQAALQQIFYNLKYSSKAVATNELLKSFGWESREAWVQHDVQEFKCLLLDALEEKMSKSSDLKGEISRLFGGVLVNYIECINVSFKSLREEKFYDVQLNIKDSNNVYESLEKYTEVETLEGDNLYDSEKFGKQEARKGTRFKSLPPVLFFQLIRFEYDYTKDMNVKITAQFEYNEHLDLNKFVDDRSKKYTYKLFSVLVHSGEGSSSGHYYAFIRPKMGHWLKFNDDVVEKAYEYQVFQSNFGGTYTDAKYNKNTKLVEENEIKNITTAYMLIYLREDHIKDLLKEVKDEEIPERLREIDFKLQKEEEKKKRKTELMKVYLTSFDVLQTNYKEPGIIYFRKGLYDENFKKEYIENKMNRYKRWVSKTTLLSKFLEDIAEEIGMTQQEFIIYKVNWQLSDDKTRLQSLNKHLKSNNGMPCTLLLKNVYLGIKNPSAYPVMLILPILKKDRIIFEKIENSKKRSKTSKMIDENEEKNVLNFVHNRNKALNEKIQIEEFEELYINIQRENFYVVFFKIFKKEENSLNFFGYDFFDKNVLIKEIYLRIIQDFQHLFTKSQNIYMYKETPKFQIEDLMSIFNEKIGENMENGTIIVFEEFEKSAEQFFANLEDNGYVTFVSSITNSDKKSLLGLSTTYEEIIDHIKQSFEEFKDVDPDNILLKTKLRRNGAYQDLIDSQEITLQDLIRFDEKVFVENSVIKISDLGSKFLLKVQFYYNDNTLSKIKEISCSKDILVKELLNDISSGKISLSDICSIHEKEKIIMFVVLDAKQNRIICVAKPDIPIHTYIIKGLNLRLEYEFDEMESDDFYVYCLQLSKTSDFIPYPFLLRASKTNTCTEIRQKLYEILQLKKLEFEKKPITINEEYFNKLKVYLKFDVNTSISKAILLENSDKEFYSYKKNESEEDRFYLEIVHSSLVSRNSTKVLKIN